MKNETLKLRPVKKNDCRLLWEWANDPEVRKSAYDSAHIPWETHLQWFEEKLDDSRCFQYIASDSNDIPVGQVRFDVKGPEAEIDVSIQKKMRGLNYGSLLIRTGLEKLVRSVKIKAVNAFVKIENKASIHAFLKSGFEDLGEKTIKGCPSRHLRWKPSS